MNKQVLVLAAALLAGAIASPALADVNVTATIDKTKTITVTETISVTKVVVIDAHVDMTNAPTAAEAMALANITNQNNTVDRTIDPAALSANVLSSNNPITRTATMTGSVTGNHGAVGVNQDSGDNANQANLIAFGFTQNGQAFTNAQASVDQVNTGNVVDWGPNPTSISGAVADPINITALIDTSINTNTGIVGVNQNAGNMNNQTNAVALAAGVNVDASGTGAGVALAESDLGQENSHNTVTEINATKSAQIHSSVNGNIGIVGVNQAVGNNGNQSNVVSVAATFN